MNRRCTASWVFTKIAADKSPPMLTPSFEVLDPRFARYASGNVHLEVHRPDDVDGTLIGKVRVPEVVAKVYFGGPKRNRLFICGTTSVYAVYLKATGVS